MLIFFRPKLFLINCQSSWYNGNFVYIIVVVIETGDIGDRSQSIIRPRPRTQQKYISGVWEIKIVHFYEGSFIANTVILTPPHVIEAYVQNMENER